MVLLGTGNPNPDPDRSGPAVAVVAGGHPYLVDCGPGVVRRAEEARRNGTEALVAEKLDIVFLTHLHSDHTLGCPDLLLSPWVTGRTAPLRVYGPPGTRALFDGILAASRGPKIGLIALATHGRGGLRRLVLGSVADKLVRTADLPVLVTRPRGK